MAVAIDRHAAVHNTRPACSEMSIFSMLGIDVVTEDAAEDFAVFMVFLVRNVALAAAKARILRSKGLEILEEVGPNGGQFLPPKQHRFSVRPELVMGVSWY